MKMFIGAIALAIAVPAAAQTVPATDPHAQHQGMDHSKHGEAKHDCKECCEKMKQQGGKMECMDKKAATEAPAGQQDHQAHAR